jgi:TrmH family RNA methyltransferase
MAQNPPAVAVIEPETPGNIGTIARAMKNFGFTDLKLIDAPELDPDGEAYGFAGQAREDVLPQHDRPTFDELIDEYHTVGFTAITNEDASKHVRYPYSTPAELAEELEGTTAEVALVFGREANGLSNEELAQLDRICSIPASESYPALNLGQAATIALYELRKVATAETQLPDRDAHRASEAEIDRLYDHFEEFLVALDHPAEKRPKTMRLLRRLVGRADPTEREVITLTGVFRRAAEYIVPPGERDPTAVDEE